MSGHPPAKIIFTTPHYELSGVNTFHANLIRALRRQGWEAELLITQKDAPWRIAMPPDPHVPTSNLLQGDETDWPARWRRLTDYLEAHAPCLYVPGYDFYYSCVSSLLSDKVGILGVLHSDEEVHYDHAVRLGRYWNRIVCVSRHIAEQTAQRCPQVADRLVTVPYGVPACGRAVRDGRAEEPLRIVYAGRLIQYQKRILDLIDVTRGLNARGVRYVLTVVGDGPERAVLAKAWKSDIAGGNVLMTGTLSNAQTQESFLQNDVVILTSAFEGLPLALLEAMGAGCVPVVSQTESGIPELIRSGETGFSVKQGNITGFVDALAALAGDRSLLQKMSRASFDAVSNGPYEIDTVAGIYGKMFDEMLQDITGNGFGRLREPIQAPPNLPLLQLDLGGPGMRPILRLRRFLRRSTTFRQFMAFPCVARMTARALRVYQAVVGFASVVERGKP